MSLQILRKGENEMAKKEVKTDLWVARQLDDSKIKYDAQGSDVKEINDALQSASKRGTGNAGYPEYVAVVKDFVIAAKNLATEMTNYNVEEKDLQGETAITVEHVENNTSVRDMLGQRGIKPENLPASEDIKKLERRVKREEKKLAEQAGKLTNE